MENLKQQINESMAGSFETGVKYGYLLAIKHLIHSGYPDSAYFLRKMLDSGSVDTDLLIHQNAMNHEK